MAITAPVTNGEIGKIPGADSSKTSAAGKGNSLGKDDFLQLLVAQMKYQDPLEPTSNTEYISQYATFSELEQMQNMSGTMEMSRGTELVGKTVTVEATDDKGNTTSDMGVVDYVSYENGKVLLWINGKSWKLDSVKEVADPAYIEAYAMATTITTALKKLPSINDLKVENADAVNSIVKAYQSMNDYQKSFLSDDTRKTINAYEEKMKELLKLKELSSDK